MRAEVAAEHRADEHRERRQYVVRRHQRRAPLGRRQVEHEVRRAQAEAGPDQPAQRLHREQEVIVGRDQPQRRHDRNHRARRDQDQAVAEQVAEAAPPVQRQELQQHRRRRVDHELDVAEVQIAQHVDDEERRRDADRELHAREEQRKRHEVGRADAAPQVDMPRRFERGDMPRRIVDLRQVISRLQRATHEIANTTTNPQYVSAGRIERLAESIRQRSTQESSRRSRVVYAAQRTGRAAPPARCRPSNCSTEGSRDSGRCSRRPTRSSSSSTA